MGVSGQLHYPASLLPGTHWIRGWVEPRASLDDVENKKFLTLPRLELQPLGSYSYCYYYYYYYYYYSYYYY
jgi:hypothetical protein